MRLKEWLMGRCEQRIARLDYLESLLDKPITKWGLLMLDVECFVIWIDTKLDRAVWYGIGWIWYDQV